MNYRTFFRQNETLCIAQKFTCSRDKTSYLAKFGIYPHIRNQLFKELGDDCFVLMFDESLNKASKAKQMDLYIRFWTNDGGERHVRSRYLGSQFMGHSTADDLMTHFKVSGGWWSPPSRGARWKQSVYWGKFGLVRIGTMKWLFLSRPPFYSTSFFVCQNLIDTSCLFYLSIAYLLQYLLFFS